MERSPIISIRFICCLLISSLLFLNGAYASNAETEKALNASTYFNIPQQTLKLALTEYAEQSGLQILFRSTDIPDIKINSISGRISNRSALIRLLQNTPLKFKSGGNKAVVVYKVKTASPKNKQKTSKQAFEHIQLPDTTLHEEVIVTGIRASVKEALKAKKQSIQVEDALYYQTIAKYPDTNAGDSLQRIPGLSVDRSWGESRNVFIRGTHSDLSQTQLDGQYMASTYWDNSDQLGRAFNYILIPAEFLASIEVLKSPSADQNEGSIGGSIDLHLKNPFTLPKQYFSYSHKQQYNDLPNTWDPKHYLVGNWRNSDSSFGVLVSAYNQKRQFKRDAVENIVNDSVFDIETGTGEVIEDVTTPVVLASTVFDQRREKQSLYTALQWDPNSALSISFNSLYSELNADNANQNYVAFTTYPFSQTTIVENAEIRPTSNNGKFLVAGTYGSEDLTTAGLSIIDRDAYVETHFNNLKIEYLGQGWNIESALGLTRAVGGNSHENMYMLFDQTRIEFQVDRDFIRFNPLDADLLRQDEDTYLESFASALQRKVDESKYAQIDFERYFNFHSISGKLKTGIKLQSHQVSHQSAWAVIPDFSETWLQLNSIPFSALSSNTFHNLSERISSDHTVPQIFALYDPNKIDRRISSITSQAWNFETLNWDNYRVKEDIKAFYLKSEFDIGKSLFDIGIRIANTEQKSTTVQAQEEKRYTQSYTNYLPNINWRYEINDALYLRASLSKAISRPNINDIGNPPRTPLASDVFKFGNPLIQPTTANQGDFGIEWYFNDESILAGNLFHKSFDCLVIQRNTTVTVDGEPQIYSILENGSGPDLFGIELQWQQSIFKHFGILANYTYTDSGPTFYYENNPQGLIGNARDQLNASIYFEKPQFSARLSYNYRSDSYGEALYTLQKINSAYDQWDLDINWSVTENIVLSLEAVNLLNEVVRVNTDSDIALEVFDFGTSYTIGIQYSIW